MSSCPDFIYLGGKNTQHNYARVLVLHQCALLIVMTHSDPNHCNICTITTETVLYIVDTPVYMYTFPLFATACICS